VARAPIMKYANTTTHKSEVHEIPQYEDIVKETIDPNSQFVGWIGFGGWDVRVYPRLIADTLLAMDSPKFVFIHNLIFHVPFYYDENGIALDPVPDNMYDVANYLPQYKYAEKVLTKLIDIILQYDPDAVIVLQGDHGIHYDPTYWDDTGYTIKEINDMSFNVFSAVRIPEKYGHLDEPLEPLNITRWLVNNYVGPNYEYVPEERSKRPQ
jgi:phosphoglycerol transferase MdoB-like AlkP superfamily enzyme